MVRADENQSRRLRQRPRRCAPNAAAALAGIRTLRDDETIMERLRRNTKILQAGIEERGLDSGHCESPVVPVILGDEFRAYQWAAGMLADGVFVSAVVFPAVARGMARLRLCATAAHEPEQFDRLFEAIDGMLEAEQKG